MTWNNFSHSTHGSSTLHLDTIMTNILMHLCFVPRLGIRMMYHHYKSSKEEEINQIRARLYGEDLDHANSRRNEPI